MTENVLFTIITPSRPDRPRALAQAVASVEAARVHAGLAPDRVEHLVGFDGPGGQRVPAPDHVRFFDFPRENNYGNGIRDGLLKAARGQRILFLDDDNALTEQALAVFMRFDEEMVIGRIDTTRGLDVPFLPRPEPADRIVRPTNIDPLCLCLSRDLVVERCRGWHDKSGYESDYRNILRWHRRAVTVAVTEEVVGIYDAGLGLDENGVGPLQARRLEQKGTS